MGPCDATKLDWAKGDGLLPAIIQHAETLQVLMLGYMNEESLKQTQDSGCVTFFSRSQNKIWQKGETSGNILKCIDVLQDCDNDTLLISAIPLGPTCHLGTTSCFSEKTATGVGWLKHLENVIMERKEQPSDKSYTSQLFASGLKRIAQKVGEEGVETALAAATGDLAELQSEVADLLYHLLVLLAASDLSLDDAVNVLRERHSPE